MRYPAPAWLPGGHLQTIYPAVAVRQDGRALRRERWQAPDGDFVDVDLLDGLPGNPTVVLFHGLEGSSQSHYAKALMAALAARGWSGAIPHFRGCSGEANLAPRFYHSGDAAEIDWLLPQVASPRPAAPSMRPASRSAATPCCAGWANSSSKPILSTPPAPSPRRSTWPRAAPRCRPD